MRFVVETLVSIMVCTSCAYGFEGVVTSRRITLGPEAVAKLGAGSPDKVLGLPVDKLRAGKEEAEITTAISIRGSQVRADVSEDVFVLMDADSGVLQVVNSKQHTVMKWNKVALGKAADRLAALPQNVQDQIAKLPPERRAALEAAVGKTPAVAGEVEVRLRDTGRDAKIAGLKCRGYEAKSAGETVVGWVSSEQADLAAAFRSFAAAEQAIRPGPKNARMLLAEKGLPVRVQSLNAHGYQVDEIIQIESKTVPSERFEVPRGYMKTEASGMLGGTPK